MTHATRIDAIADAGFAPVADNIAHGGVPGAVLGVVSGGGGRAVRFAGHAAIVPERVAMTPDLFFDLASLTKVVLTTDIVLRLADEGRLSLDDPIAAAIPDLRQYDVAGAPERRLTFRQCLAHQSFLPAVEPVYTQVPDPRTARAHVLQRAFPHGPPVYSDINFLLLGIAIERITGRPLDRQPLAPGFAFSPDPDMAVATEYCPWRERMLRGIVHDENAHAFGGVAGHAGLFGTIDAVLDFARGVLDGSGMSPAGIAAIRTPAGHGRTVGWVHDWFPDRAGEGGGPAPVISHLGFTGTGLWIDFDHGIAWALLTNRVHPTRHRDTGIMPLRRAVSAAIAGAATSG